MLLYFRDSAQYVLGPCVGNELENNILGMYNFASIFKGMGYVMKSPRLTLHPFPNRDGWFAKFQNSGSTLPFCNHPTTPSDRCQEQRILIWR